MQEISESLSTHPKRILFCWSDISGYMAACWKALNGVVGVQLHIIAFGKSDETSFKKDLIAGLRIYFVSRHPTAEEITSIARPVSPDIIVLCGWFVPAYKQLRHRKEFDQAKFILAMDTPWQGTARQQLAVLLMRSYMRKMDAVLASGERSYQYARRLGARKIFKFQYGVDGLRLRDAYDKRAERKEWPRKFLFVGRYSHEKGISILVEAYKEYRKNVSDPWELHTCGQGILKNLLNETGITDHGFVQPDDMFTHWTSSGCLVLASVFDPWPLILIEACAAGLPVIATHAAGSQVEAVKMYYNGFVINEKSGDELTSALLWMHHHHAHLKNMGAHSLKQAEPYNAQLWAVKMSEVIMQDL